jgi:hypothetical protein
MEALFFISQCCKFSVFNLALIKVLHFRPHDDESFAIAKLTMMKILYFSCHNDIRSPFLILQRWKLSIFNLTIMKVLHFSCHNDRVSPFLILQCCKFYVSHLTLMKVLHFSFHGDRSSPFIISKWWKFSNSHLTIAEFLYIFLISLWWIFSISHLAMIKALHSHLTLMNVLNFSCHNDESYPLLISQWRNPLFIISHLWKFSTSGPTMMKVSPFLNSQWRSYSISHVTMIEVLHF